MEEIAKRGETAVAKKGRWSLPVATKPVSAEQAKELAPQCGLSVVLQATRLAYLHMGALKMEEMRQSTKVVARGVVAHERLRDRNNG